ncbi:hypothetical protein O181_122679 [Austropuccinia psidii MF-1]|uniref:Uncharacterized protein n=1 Tax=Austropuccinia psidii MF-1 TaxID=1389203 RepID=A0A9Q3Q2J1_9BASI|nr:hypothetical protein [Austropuccinia psidii MF-1]
MEQALPTELQNSKERKDIHGQCVQYGKTSDGIQKQGGGKIETIFPKEIDIVKLVTSFESSNKENNIVSLTQICARIQSKVTLINQPDDNSISFIAGQLRGWKLQVQKLENSTGHNAALFQEQLEESDKSRLELKEEIQSSINNISLKNELLRQSTPIHDRNVLGLNNDLHHTISSNYLQTTCNFKDIPKLEEWPTFNSEGEYDHMEFMRTIDMFKEEFNIQDEYISARLHSFLPDQKRNGITK